MSTVQKHNAPALRFKDESGREYPDWENHSLDKIATVTMGTSPASTAYNQNGVGLPLIQGNADIKNRKSIPRVYTSIITKECLPNDTLLSVRAPVGEVSRSDHHACIGRGIASIRVREAAVRQIFLYNYLVWHEPKWRSISQGSTFEAVNSNDIRSLRVKIPSKSEQQKITAFLSAVDTKIEQLDRKKSLLEQYKKGMMQKLFSREIRFKDEGGRDYPDWEETKIGVVGEIHGGGTPDTNEKSLWNGEIIWFTPTEIKSKYSKSSARKISKAGLAQSSATLLPAGTILFTSRATIGEVSIATH